MRVCIFAAACDLTVAQEVLLGLPPDAYGQVYLADTDEVDLVAPARVQVNRLSPALGPCPLAEAMTGWAAEWLPEGVELTGDIPTVWVLPGATDDLRSAGHECVTRLITALPSDQLIHG